MSSKLHKNIWPQFKSSQPELLRAQMSDDDHNVAEQFGTMVLR